MTNEEIIAKITEEATLRALSPATEKEYQKSIRVFLRHYNNRPLEEMGEPEIRSFLLHLLKIGRKSGTVNIYNCGLRFTYRAVMERNLNYQMIPRRRIHRELPVIMPKIEITILLETPENLRDKAILSVFYGSGLRLSELIHLRVQDIDSEGMRLKVRIIAEIPDF